MNTWQTSWRPVWLHPPQYLLNAVLWAGVHTLPLVPGLIIRQLFNRLTDGATLGWDYWTLIALLVGVGVGRLIWLLISVTAP